MLLEFEFTKGYCRNTIVDFRDQKIYYLDHTQGPLEYYLEEETCKIGEGFQDTPVAIKRAGILDIMEMKGVPLEKQSELAMTGTELLIDFLIVHCEDSVQYLILIENLDQLLSTGSLSYRRIYLVINDDEYEKIPKLDSNIYHVMSESIFNNRRSISIENFVLESDTVLESFNYNTFYNRRLMVNQKNYQKIEALLALKKPLLELSKKINKLQPSFDLWEITKSKIAICRDCEYRKICVDSINIELNNDYYVRVVECPYNPYIAKWNTEEGHQTVPESIADGVVSEEFVYREK
jgi:hypothetical protein